MHASFFIVSVFFLSERDERGCASRERVRQGPLQCKGECARLIGRLSPPFLASIPPREANEARERS